MQRVFTITEADTSESGGVVNLAHLFSSYNRKYIPQVDKKGNAQLFHINVRSISSSSNTVTLKSASNSYPTKQAVKAWHRVWRDQFRKAKIPIKSLGKYGQNLRIALTSSDTALGSGNEDGTGEWTYSEVIVTPSVDPGDNSTITGHDLTDSYTLQLCGSSTWETADDTLRFTNVGMINTWIDSRRKPTGLDADDVTESALVGTDNPLLHARGDSFTSELLVEEVREFQSEEPPYDDSISESVITQGILKSNADLIGERVVQVPCGLLQVDFTAACTLEFELIAITDME
jgi:hypothetical protein